MNRLLYKLMVTGLVLAGANAGAQTIVTLVGNSSIGGTFAGDGGPATAAGLSAPAGAAMDSYGNIYIADKFNYVIRKVSPSGIISTIAGTSGVGGHTGDGGAATSANIHTPVGLTVDVSGNVYVAEYGGSTIRKISTSGIITTVAGVNISGYSGDGGAATSAKLSYPTDVAFDGTGNMYISDWNNGLVRKVSVAGDISTFAGGGSSYADGIAATAASFYANNGVATDIAGNVYVADMNNNRICKITTSGLCYTIAGDGTAAYSGDGGAATAARMNGPAFLTVDRAGNVFFSDHNNHVIRKVDASGIISTVAGNGTSGYSGDGGAATAAELARPAAIFFDREGGLCIVDQSNDVIRKVVAAPLTLAGGTTMCIGDNSTLSSTAPSGDWTSSNTAIATVSSTGVVTGVGAGTATISYAVSLGFGTVTVTINDCSLSASAINPEKTVAVYPNPGSDVVSVTTAGFVAEHIDVVDVLGRVVMRSENVTNRETKLDISQIPSGNYIIRAYNDGQMYHQRLTIGK